jgi:competence protein ComEC
LFRRGASINTVALAAFAMLALKPSLVADPGFQLSFIAVAAIVSIAMPVIDRLRSVGEWRPTPETPHPPSCSRALRLLSESLFWNEREFREEMSRSVIRYRAHKSAVARALGLWRVQPVIRGAAVLIITSAAIQIATLPLTAFYFNRAAPVGVMLNVAAGLFTALLMFSGVAAIAIGAISQPIAGLFEKLGDLAHYLLVNEIAPFRWIPGATFRVAHYEGEGAFWYFAFYVPIFFLIVLIDRWRPVAFKREVPLEKANVQRSRGAGEQGSRRSLAYALICMTAVIAGCVMIVRPAGSDHDGKLRIHFLDVGQGDAALIVFPGGSTMLIDAGGDFDFTGREMNIEDEETERGFRDNAHSIGEMVVSRFLWSKGLTEIDYALATHAHIDHIGGLTDAVRNFQPGQLILARAPADSLKMTRLVDLCSERRIPLGAIGAGDRFEIEGVRVETLWPERGEDIGSESGNDESIVLRIVYGSASVLLAGDIEQETEASLLRSVDDLRADVLKVPHHGSRSSSTQRFIDAVSPRWAVISVGERSRFGHPHREVIDRYKDKGVTVLQTGRDGMVTVESDGASIDVRTFGPR